MLSASDRDLAAMLRERARNVAYDKPAAEIDVHQVCDAEDKLNAAAAVLEGLAAGKGDATARAPQAADIERVVTHALAVRMTGGWQFEHLLSEVNDRLRFQRFAPCSADDLGPVVEKLFARGLAPDHLRAVPGNA